MSDRATAWRLFPWAIGLGLATVIAVNGYMVASALRSFPGGARGGEGFDLSNRYNAVIEQTKERAAVGWQAVASVRADNRPVVLLIDRDGTPIRGAKVTAMAERPVGVSVALDEVFDEDAPGRYVGRTALTMPGQWDVHVTVATDGHGFAATRRVVAK